MGRLKEVIGKVLTLDSSVRPYIFLITLLALALASLKFLENFLPQFSICAMVFGKYCYSIGITRGVSSLLKGNLEQAISYNWISIVVVVVMVLIIIVDFRKLFSKNKH